MIVEEFKPSFHFKQFSIAQERAAMKLNTDGVLLGAWTKVKKATNILDIGTGTGILALMMAQKSKQNSKIIAVEIDENACLDAQMNFTNSPFGNFLKKAVLKQDCNNTKFWYVCICKYYR